MVKSVPKVAIRSQGQARVTQVEVERTCGHVEVLEVRGDPSRSAFLDNARMRDCSKCYRQKQTEADGQAVAEGKRCELDGSEKQVAWASGVRQRRAVEFGRAINDAAAWAKEAMAKGDALTLAVAKARTKVAQQAISDLFLGKVTWGLLDQDGNEVEVDSGRARFWIDTRELELRDFVAAMLPQFRWESYRDWEPLFRDEAEDGPIDDAEEFVAPAPAPAPAPAKPASAKPAAKAGLFDDDDIPF